VLQLGVAWRWGFDTLPVRLPPVHGRQRAAGLACAWPPLSTQPSKCAILCSGHRDWGINHACRVVLGGRRAAPEWLREQRTDGQGVSVQPGVGQQRGDERNSAASSRTPISSPAVYQRQLRERLGAGRVPLCLRSERQLLSAVRSALQSAQRPRPGARRLCWLPKTGPPAPTLHGPSLVLLAPAAALTLAVHAAAWSPCPCRTSPCPSRHAARFRWALARKHRLYSRFSSTAHLYRCAGTWVFAGVAPRARFFNPCLFKLRPRFFLGRCSVQVPRYPIASAVLPPEPLPELRRLARMGKKRPEPSASERPSQPVTLGGMRALGIRSVYVTCSACGYASTVIVTTGSETLTASTSASMV
jgi:hypothetical protein